ncbi:MFS transporter [Streptomyces noursei]|uniref:MFS transporter n=1 Tax=Streptomyces noursei TaxID=1971 RepID=UPI0019648CDC|nr:MFS transporter [Streptomyces noursei]QRX94664.1 MFS transporter [Streptomyces noursei]
MTLPLRRNTNYHLLWGSQALSELGAQISVFALPLLVLMLTDSAVDAGAAGAVSALTRLVVLVPAGALIDRWHRKRIMLLCELARVPMMVGLALMLLGDGVAFGYILAVAVVDGAAAAMFAPAEEAALPQVVAKEQLPTAVSVSAARSYLATLAGPGIGGFLFTAHKALPFLVNGVTYAGSFVMLLFLRLKGPGGAGTAGARRSLVGEIGEGVGWIWRRPVIRASMAVAVGVSVCFNALYLIVLTLAQRAKIPAAEIGAIGVLVGAGGLAGALLAPRMHRLLTPRAAIILLGWLGAGLTPLLLVRTSGYLFGAVLAAIAFLAPTVQTAVVTYQMALTPDRLRGRVSAALGLAGGVAGAAGPLLGGLLVDAAGPAQAVLSCAGVLLLAALAAGVSPALRAFTSVHGTPEADEAPSLSPSSVPSVADPADAAGPEPTSATSEPLER